MYLNVLHGTRRIMDFPIFWSTRARFFVESSPRSGAEPIKQKCVADFEIASSLIELLRRLFVTLNPFA